LTKLVNPFINFWDERDDLPSVKVQQKSLIPPCLNLFNPFKTHLKGFKSRLDSRLKYNADGNPHLVDE